MMMTSTFDSFDESELGGFVESPLGARNAPSVRSVYIGTTPSGAVTPVIAKLNPDNLSEIVEPPRGVRGSGFNVSVGGNSDVGWAETVSRSPGPASRLHRIDPNTLAILQSRDITGNPFEDYFVFAATIKGTANSVWGTGLGFANSDGAGGFRGKHIVRINPETLLVNKISSNLILQFGDTGAISGGDERLWLIRGNNERLLEISIPEFLSSTRADPLVVLRTIDLSVHAGFRTRVFLSMGGGDGSIWFLTRPETSLIPREAFEFDPDRNEILQGPVRIDLIPGLHNAESIGGE